MKKILIVTILFGTCIQIQAQSFGKSLLQGVLNGVSEGIKRSSQQTQRRSSNSFSLENTHATPIQSGNSFSLANTSATVLPDPRKKINFSDGSEFYGTMTESHANGKLSYANGEFCDGGFDSSWEKDGKCYVRYPSGDWYYGYFEHGVENGEGSLYTDGEYYDLIFNMGEITKSVHVTKPKYDKQAEEAAYSAALYTHTMQMLQEQQQQYNVNTSTSSSSKNTSSNKSQYSTSDINRQADRTAKAYEMYKSDPNGTSSRYYRSNRDLLKTMQGKK